MIKQLLQTHDIVRFQVNMVPVRLPHRMRSDVLQAGLLGRFVQDAVYPDSFDRLPGPLGAKQVVVNVHTFVIFTEGVN